MKLPPARSAHQAQVDAGRGVELGLDEGRHRLRPPRRSGRRSSRTTSCVPSSSRSATTRRCTTPSSSSAAASASSSPGWRRRTARTSWIKERVNTVTDAKERLGVYSEDLAWRRLLEMDHKDRVELAKQLGGTPDEQLSLFQNDVPIGNLTWARPPSADWVKAVMKYRKNPLDLLWVGSGNPTGWGPLIRPELWDLLKDYHNVIYPEFRVKVFWAAFGNRLDLQRRADHAFHRRAHGQEAAPRRQVDRRRPVLHRRPQRPHGAGVHGDHQARRVQRRHWGSHARSWRSASSPSAPTRRTATTTGRRSGRATSPTRGSSSRSTSSGKRDTGPARRRRRDPAGGRPRDDVLPEPRAARDRPCGRRQEDRRHEGDRATSSPRATGSGRSRRRRSSRRRCGPTSPSHPAAGRRSRSS